MNLEIKEREIRDNSSKEMLFSVDVDNRGDRWGDVCSWFSDEIRVSLMR